MAYTPIKGLQYFFQGLALTTKPGLRQFVIVPTLINLLLFGLLIYFALDQFDYWLDYFLAKLPAWLGFLEWLAWLIAVVLILVIVFYAFSLVANLIAAPFYGFLAEKTEKYLTGKDLDEDTSLAAMLKLIPHTIKRELQKMLHYFPRVIIAFIISLIFPTIAPLVWFYFGATMMAIQYCDYPMDNHLVNFKTMQRSLQQKPITSQSFGAIVMAGSVIPFINIIVMPAAVCGATAYWVEELAEVTNSLENKSLPKPWH